MKTYRMFVTNRVSGKTIRVEFVQAENFDIAIDAVRAKLNSFEACDMGVRA